MANLMCNKTGKAARAMIWLLMLFLVFQRVLPFILSNSPHLWILIKRRKFIYIILNFIIISILISSSSSSSFTPYLTNVFLRLHQKTKLLKVSFHNDDSCYNCQKAVDPSDDDTWWFFTTYDHEYIMTPSTEEDKEEEYQNHVEEKETRKEEEQEQEVVEEDSLEATWKAIMEAKGKESGPQLNKSGYGDGGVDERRKEKGRLSKYRVNDDELKKWRSSREVVEKREIFDGGDGGGKRGWRSMEAALTFHDDLKKRADAFIARFTHDIHLQRLESDQRFLDMINGGM